MADVRAMLRAERAARAPSPKARKQAAPAPASASKKRKADNDDTDTRKRPRAQDENANVPADFFDERDDAAEEEEAELQAPIPGFVPANEDDPSIAISQELRDKGAYVSATKGSTTNGVTVQADMAAQLLPDSVDESEWAAFQEFASSVPSKSALDALKSNATLEAAPISAEEAAAQAREEQSKQHNKREEEIDEEKEEAAERLEEEFELMEDLEDRIRKLKEKRETLRRASKASADAERPASKLMVHPEAVIEESEEEDSEDDDADEFDGWRFGGS
jgi:hypothetical protein